jgi:hypothetical protein
MVCIGFWIAAQACLLAQAILSSIRLPYLANIQFYFIYFVLLTVIPGMIILLVRRRTCSYVGTAGAVQYDMAFDRTVEEWSIRFADCRTLKKSTVNSYRNGIYVTTTETRCFETADGGEQLFSYNWDNPEKISCFIPGVMPDVRATFWQKIESLWAMRGG